MDNQVLSEFLTEKNSIFTQIKSQQRIKSQQQLTIGWFKMTIRIFN